MHNHWGEDAHWTERQVADTPLNEQLTMFSSQITEHTAHLLRRAREEAKRFDHLAISSEHVLLAVLRESDRGGALVLRRLGVDLLHLHDTVIRRMGPPGERVRAGVAGLTAAATGAVRCAGEEARRLGRDRADPEHLLLGLWCASESNAGRSLAGLNVTLEQARLEVMRSGADSGDPAHAAALASHEPAIVTLRLSGTDLAAIDALMDAGIYATREEACIEVIHVGITTSPELFEGLVELVEQMRQLRASARALFRRIESAGRQGT